MNNTIKVWLFSQGKTNPVATIGLPIGDCICRFGLPTEVLSFSPDGQHLAVGCVAGKGSTPLMGRRPTSHPAEYWPTS